MQLDTGIELENFHANTDDVIILKINPDIISPKACLEIYDKVKSFFPNNKIITIYGGIEITKQ